MFVKCYISYTLSMSYKEHEEDRNSADVHSGSSLVLNTPMLKSMSNARNKDTFPLQGVIQNYNNGAQTAQ